MKCFELALQEELGDFVDRVARDACAAAPGLGCERARGLIDLVLRTRLRRCAACAHENECGCERPGRHLHDDARELANICASNAADLVDRGTVRDGVEARLSSVLYRAFAPVVVDGRECHACAGTRGR